ncbi:tetratricopeptide repeat protein [bacterium]|nr:MAG: tetratricopeptide repeat protein [bacterium]
MKNLEPHSVALMKRGVKALNEDRTEEAILLFNGAKTLSPDLPLSYLYLAKAYFSFSQEGFYTTSSYLLKSWDAFWSNFWWSFQTSGMIGISLYFSLYISIVVFSSVLIASKFNLYLHDVMEDKRKTLLLLPPLVLVFFGPIFGLIGFLLPFWIYLKPRERGVLYCCLSLLVLTIFILPFFSSFLGASQDKTLRDIVRINNGIYTGEATVPSAGSDSFESMFLYALDKKRKGHFSESIKMYEELLNQGEDARVYNNLANCYIGLDDYDSALNYYNKSLKLSKMATAYYNLSQLYREVFNFEEAEKYYEKAVSIDPLKVNVYKSLKGASVNSLVMDETLSPSKLWELPRERNHLYKSSRLMGRMFFFTNRGFSLVLLLLVIFALSFYGKKVASGAYRCRRCGEIFCSECEKKLLKEDICHTCFKTLVKVTELKSKERIERILEIQGYREERNTYLKVLTLIIPGIGHVYYGWTVFGFSLILLSSFFLSSSFSWFYFPVPVSMGQTAFFAKWMSVAGLVLVYGFSAERVLRRIPRRWL